MSAAGAVEDLLSVWLAQRENGGAEGHACRWCRFWDAWSSGLRPLDVRRPRSVACMLRPTGRSSRSRFLRWMKKAARMLPLDPAGVTLGEVDEGVHLSHITEYRRRMMESRVVVTARPPNWDGDCRTWEALVSGALVVTEPFWIPSSALPEDGRHVRWVYGFAPAEDHFVDVVRGALEDAVGSRRIANAGFWHALSHHRGIHRVDSLLRAAVASRESGQRECMWKD